MFKPVAIIGMCAGLVGPFCWAQDPQALSVKELMTSIIAPETTAIWGAFEVKPEQWQGGCPGSPSGTVDSAGWRD